MLLHYLNRERGIGNLQRNRVRTHFSHVQKCYTAQRSNGTEAMRLRIHTHSTAAGRDQAANAARSALASRYSWSAVPST